MDPATTNGAGEDGETIVLAGKDYRIRPLTLGQLRRVLPRFIRVGQLTSTTEAGVAFFATPEAAEEAYEISVHILATALKRDHGLDVDTLDSMEIKQGEVDRAIGAIARLSGLKPAVPGAAPGGPPQGS